MIRKGRNINDNKMMLISVSDMIRNKNRNNSNNYNCLNSIHIIPIIFKQKNPYFYNLQIINIYLEFFIYGNMYIIFMIP